MSKPNNDLTETAQSVALVIEKIEAAQAQGEECAGMVFGKSIATWKGVFNAAAKTLKMDIVHIAPLKGGSMKEVRENMTDVTKAFKKAAAAPVIILVDSTGNDKLKDPQLAGEVSNYIQSLTVQFPKAIFVQIIPNAASPSPVNMYCMKPKVPRKANEPIYPV